MTSKTPSGQISASDLRNVFGETGSNGRVDLGNFRVSHDVDEMTNLPLDEQVPQSGQISFNQLRGKRLNIIVRYGNETRPKSGSIRYDDGGADVVVLRPTGSSKSKPSSSQGCRVTLHVRGRVSTSDGERNQRYKCALRTGTGWETDTRLEVNVGEEGEIVGGGGDGGKGSRSEDAAGGNGQSGSSALGVQYTLYRLTVQSGGEIRAGGGGGGGGGAGREDSRTDRRRGGGGGGGGGAGVPAGRRGEGSGDPNGPGGGSGENGDAGSERQGGRGGQGGENDGEAFGGGGGGGGAPGGTAGQGGNARESGENGSTGDGSGGDGGRGRGEQGESNGGEGGSGGFAYVIKSGANIERFTGSSRIDGSTTSGFTGSI